jgi:hypothetical protein
MPKIVFERLKVNEKKKIFAGTSDSGCPTNSPDDPTPITDAASGCPPPLSKSILPGCWTIFAVCRQIEEPAQGTLSP